MPIIHCLGDDINAEEYFKIIYFLLFSIVLGLCCYFLWARQEGRYLIAKRQRAKYTNMGCGASQ